jgi:diguanylate cyclase (GGDEF)-like protein/PAS domain S-box-containing protein
LLDNLYDGVFFVDPQRRILYWNQGAERISGYRDREVVGRRCGDLAPGCADCSSCRLCQVECPLARTLRTGEPVMDRVTLRHKDGRHVAAEIHAMAIRNAEAQVIGGVAIFRDASTTVALELAYGHLREQAEKDALTGVANRGHLDALVAEQLAVSRRTGLRFSMIMADLDRFKGINDTWGHEMGDRVLRAFASALKGLSRSTDVVGRYGGDEFLVVLPGTHLQDALDVAERMRIAAPTVLPPDEVACRPTVSLGVVEAGPDDSPASVLRRVDAALYLAKSRGRNRVESKSSAEKARPADVLVFEPPERPTVPAANASWVL